MLQILPRVNNGIIIIIIHGEDYVMMFEKNSVKPFQRYKVALLKRGPHKCGGSIFI